MEPIVLSFAIERIMRSLVLDSVYLHCGISPLTTEVRMDVKQVMLQIARIKRQRDLVKASLIPEAAKAKLLKDLDAQEAQLAADVVADSDKKGAK